MRVLEEVKIIPLKKITDEALDKMSAYKKMYCELKERETKVNWVKDRDVWYHEITSEQFPTNVCLKK